MHESKSEGRVLGMHFVSEREVLMVTETGKVVMYFIKNKKLMEHQVENIKIWNEEGKK